MCALSPTLTPIANVLFDSILSWKKCLTHQQLNEDVLWALLGDRSLALNCWDDSQKSCPPNLVPTDNEFYYWPSTHLTAFSLLFIKQINFTLKNEAKGLQRWLYSKMNEVLDLFSIQFVWRMAVRSGGGYIAVEAVSTAIGEDLHSRHVYANEAVTEKWLKGCKYIIIWVSHKK